MIFCKDLNTCHPLLLWFSFFFFFSFSFLVCLLLSLLFPEILPESTPVSPEHTFILWLLPFGTRWRICCHSLQTRSSSCAAEESEVRWQKNLDAGSSSPTHWPLTSARFLLRKEGSPAKTWEVVSNVLSKSKKQEPMVSIDCSHLGVGAWVHHFWWNLALPPKLGAQATVERKNIQHTMFPVHVSALPLTFCLALEKSV